MNKEKLINSYHNKSDYALIFGSLGNLMSFSVNLEPMSTSYLLNYPFFGKPPVLLTV